MTNEELYFEEQRQLLIGLNEKLDKNIERQDKQLELIEKQIELVNAQIDKYVAPKDEVKVLGKVEVNTETEVEVSNLDEQTEKIIQAVNAIKPLSQIEVKNIKDAIAKTVSIDNLQEVENELTLIREAIEAQDFNVNVEKQKLPNTPKDYLSVRLTDGKQFYNAVTQLTNAIGQLPLVRSDETGQLVMAIANADGSLITGGTGTTPTPVDNLLLETGDNLLLENGDLLLTE